MARRSFWAAPSRPVGARGPTGPQGITISDNNQYRVTAGYADDGLVTLENMTITKGTNIANEFSCGRRWHWLRRSATHAAGGQRWPDEDACDSGEDRTRIDLRE